MSKKYLQKGSALAGPITPPQSPGSAISPSLAPELLAKVSDRANGQPVSFSSESTKKVDREKKAVIQESYSDTSSSRKQVHWTPNIQDNQGKTIRKSVPRLSRSEDKTIALSSKTHRRTRRPVVPDPPRSRGPPPAPRPRRLPTPDLPDMKCEDFCDCCYTAPMSKMNAQRKTSTPSQRSLVLTREVAAAVSHIASTRQLPRRLN